MNGKVADVRKFEIYFISSFWPLSNQNADMVVNVYGDLSEKNRATNESL